ncbi:uncharacterized protein METZ01_LOCUS224132 [marine metagenome]|uniref:Uncharacterized protein n=1 Tax=marine metagenome TaxID=408172 RepID=A0A382G7S0_9ZZZZ
MPTDKAVFRPAMLGRLGHSCSDVFSGGTSGGIGTNYGRLSCDKTKAYEPFLNPVRSAISLAFTDFLSFLYVDQDLLGFRGRPKKEDN